MVGIVTGIVLGTILGAAVATGVAGYTAKKAGQKTRASSVQRRAQQGKLRGKRLDRALAKNYKRQITAIRWGQMPLMEKVNAFDYAVNKDSDFEPLWEQSNYLGVSNRQNRRLAVCKSQIKIAELKNKNVGRFQKRRDKIVSTYGVGPMKTMGWIESLPRVGGGEFVNQIKGYGKKDSGAYTGGVDNEIRYVMAATFDPNVGYDPSDLFQKAQQTFRKTSTDSGVSFLRFGINYPTTAGLVPDRFVVGPRKDMFQTSKLVILANACSKLANNTDVKKVQVIDESQPKKNRVKYLTRTQFADYVSTYFKNEGKSGMKALEALDFEQAKEIKNTLSNYTAAYNIDIQK